MKLRVEDDGVTHINVSYLAKTELGRLLNDSSDLRIDWEPYSKCNLDRMTYRFTAYGFLAFLLTGSKDYHLAEASIDEIREHMSNNPVRWTDSVVQQYRYGLKKRLDDERVYELMSANQLPIVSYIRRGDGIEMRKNDRILVELYDHLSVLMSGRRSVVAT